MITTILPTFNTRMIRGTTFSFTRTFVDVNGNPVDLTGAVIEYAIRADMKIPPTVQLSSDLAPPTGWRTGVVINPDQNSFRGQYTVTVIPTDTATLTALGDDDPWIHECLVKIAGAITPDFTSSKLAIWPNSVVAY